MQDTCRMFEQNGKLELDITVANMSCDMSVANSKSLKIKGF